MNAEPGTHVQVELWTRAGTRERMEFDLVADDAADFDKGLLGINTPLAQAILNQPEGATIPYKRGDILQLDIITVRAGTTSAPAGAAEKREALLRQALDKADLTNAINFALTFDTKWGDYDPEGIEKNWERDSKT